MVCLHHHFSVIINNILDICFCIGTCLWVFSPEKELSCCCLMPNGKTLVYGFVGTKSLQIAIRPKSNDDDSSSCDAQSEDDFITDMCSKILPYGQNDRQGKIVDLK